MRGTLIEFNFIHASSSPYKGLLLGLLIPFLLVGCTPFKAASPSAPGSQSFSSTIFGGNASAPVCVPNASIDPGRVILRRLNRTEYSNTVNDLFGISVSLTASMDPDNFGVTFDNQTESQSLNDALVAQYYAASQTVVSAAFTTQKAKIMTCTPPATAAATCAKSIIATWTEKAFRRPPTDTELTDFFNFYSQESVKNDFETTIREVISAILMSPQFLFHRVPQPNPNDPTQIVNLDPYSLAERLSYFLWMSIPDDTLYATAKNGTITTPSVLKAQVQRMLLSPKAGTLTTVFANEWFQLYRLAATAPDPTLFPNVTSSLKQSMINETQMLVQDVITNNAPVKTLLTADYTYLNGDLANLYGVSGVTGTNFQKVSALKDRKGITTQASVLALASHPTETSIVRRGVWVLNNIMCADIPPPPPGIPPLAAPSPGGTQRERLEMHAKYPACAGCHNSIDPIGFALEGFDALGRWRSVDENKLALDLVGQMPDGQSFNGSLQLVNYLTNGSTFMTCASTKMLNFGLGREITNSDKCSLQKIGQTADLAASTFSDLVYNVVTSPQFMRQRGEK